MTQEPSAKIEPISSPKNQLGTISKVAKDEEKQTPGQDKNIDGDRDLIQATRLLLRDFGIRKSGAAIRDAVELPHEQVGPKEIVTALSAFGFKASFGSVKLKNLSEEFFPLIAFKINGGACLINSSVEEEKLFRELWS